MAGMAPRRRRSNPLALAILAVLFEQPRHPYDVAATLKERKKHESIRLNYGSLYNVVEQLLADGFIEVRQVVREGRRPERTIYGITDAGVAELTDWLSDLVASPHKEYLQFEAALSLLPSLPPEEVADLLERRIEALDVDLARSRAEKRVFQEELGLPRLFALEAEYAEALLRAEREFVADLVGEIRKGSLEGYDLWAGWYATDHQGPPGLGIGVGQDLASFAPGVPIATTARPTAADEDRPAPSSDA